MSLSERVRSDCEAAPWVLKEIKEMESRISALEAEKMILAKLLGSIALAGDKAKTKLEIQLVQIAQQVMACPSPSTLLERMRKLEMVADTAREYSQFRCDCENCWLCTFRRAVADLDRSGDE